MANSKDEGVKDFALGLGNMLMISAFDVDAVKDIFYDQCNEADASSLLFVLLRR